MSASSHRGSYVDDEHSYRPSSSHTSHSHSLKSASRNAPPARPQAHSQSHSAKDSRPSTRHSPPRSPSPSHARLRSFSSSNTAASSALRTASLPSAATHSTSHPLLSSEAFHELQAAFQVFDRDGSGRVPISIIVATLRSLPPHPSHALLSSLLTSSSSFSSSSSSSSSGGTVTFDEFVALLTTGGSSGGDSSSSSGRVEWERVFALMDEGGKGWLDESDMERVRRMVVGGSGAKGGASSGGSRSELRAMLTRADLNGDGVVSRDEFVALMLEDKLV